MQKREVSVTIFEKNEVAGGRCGQLIHDGHRFDLGATMLLMPGVYKEVFGALVELDFEKKILQPVKLGELYRLYFYYGKQISFLLTDRAAMEEQLEAIQKGTSPWRKSM